VTARISPALALHNHQPVGNFGWVIAEVFEQAYLPMVDALERHPSVRVALHYSGPLLDWMRAERPEFIARLRILADRGQVEIMGGGYAEPILVSLPERDRIGQLRRMADEVGGIQHHLREPCGLDRAQLGFQRARQRDRVHPEMIEVHARCEATSSKVTPPR